MTLLAFSPDGESLYACGPDDRLKRWPAAGPCDDPPTYEHAENGQAAVGPNGDWMATESAGKIIFLDPKTLVPLGRSLAAPAGRLAAGPDGRTIAVGGDGTLHLIDATDGQVLRTFRGPDRETAADGLITDVAFSSDGALLASSSAATGRFQFVGRGERATPGGRGRGRRLLSGVPARRPRPRRGGQGPHASVRGGRSPAGDGRRPANTADRGRGDFTGRAQLACLAHAGPGAGEATLWPLPEAVPAETEAATGRRADLRLVPDARWPTYLLNDDPKKLAFDRAGRPAGPGAGGRRGRLHRRRAGPALAPAGRPLPDAVLRRRRPALDGVRVRRCAPGPCRTAARSRIGATRRPGC